MKVETCPCGSTTFRKIGPLTYECFLCGNIMEFNIERLLHDFANEPTDNHCPLWDGPAVDCLGKEVVGGSYD